MWQNRLEKASATPHQTCQGLSGIDPCRPWCVAENSTAARSKFKMGSPIIRNAREQFIFFRRDADLPERIILLDGSGSVSFDVLSWLAEQNVSLIRIDWKGDIVCVAGASGYSANPFRVHWQLETRENPGLRNEFCRSTNCEENRSEHFDARKINSPLRQMGAGNEIGLFGIDPA